MASSLAAVFEAAIRVKSTYDKIMFQNQKKRENVEIKEIFLHKSPSKRLFRQNSQLANELMPEEALTFTVSDAYR